MNLKCASFHKLMITILKSSTFMTWQVNLKRLSTREITFVDSCYLSLHIILVKAQILNRHNDTSSQWEQCVVNIQNDSLCHSVWLKREMKKTCKWQEMEVNFELHVGPWRCWMSTGRSQWAYLCITVPLFSCYVCDFKTEWDILQQHVSNSDSH